MQIFTKIILTIAIISGVVYPQEFWKVQNSPTNQKLEKVCFIDSTTGWVVGDTGTIIHTTDAGNNWIVQNSGITNNIFDVFFTNSEDGWAVAWNNDSIPYGTLLLKTSNGGEEWTHQFYRESDTYFMKIYFLDSLNGYLAGYSGAFVKTIDGGTTWHQVKLDTATVSHFPILNLNFLNHQKGFACGGYIDLTGVIWKTTNYGENWTTYAASPEPLDDIYIIDSLNILLVGGDLEYGPITIRSTNGGETWNYNNLQLFGVATALSFRTSSEIWSPLSFAQNFMYSLDTGYTWNIYATPDSSTIYDLVFTDSLHGYAIGEKGRILKYIPQKPDAVEISNNLPLNFKLFQNYPNPFNPNTKIEFTISDFGFVELKVYDILGREIASLVNKKMEPGNYSIDFNGSEYPSGIYFYKLSSDCRTITKKMVLMK